MNIVVGTCFAQLVISLGSVRGNRSSSSGKWGGLRSVISRPRVDRVCTCNVPNNHLQ